MSEDTTTNNEPNPSWPAIEIPQYLYKVLTYDNTGGIAPNKIQEDLMYWGVRGWELVSVTETQLPASYTHYNSDLSRFRNHNYQTVVYLKNAVPIEFPCINEHNYDVYLDVIEYNLNECQRKQTEYCQRNEDV